MMIMAMAQDHPPQAKGLHGPLPPPLHEEAQENVVAVVEGLLEHHHLAANIFEHLLCLYLLQHQEQS